MIDTHAALEALIQHAYREDYKAVGALVDGLAASRDSTLLPKLYKAFADFLDTSHLYGCEVTAQVLAGIAGVTALPTLLLAADRELEDGELDLYSTLHGLLNDDQEAARPLVLALVRSTSTVKCLAGLRGMQQVARPEDIELLAEVATRPDAQVRQRALDVIPHPADNERAFRVLATGLQDPDEEVRLLVLTRIAANPHPAAVEPLALLHTDPSAVVRAKAAYALGRIATPEALPALRLLLQDPDQRVRDQARGAVGLVGGSTAVDTLLTEAAATEPRRRASAAKALAKLVDDDPRAETQFMQLSRDPDGTVRAAVLSGLADIGDPSGRWTPLVIAFADDPDVTVRHRVAVTARHLLPDACDLLDRLAADPKGFVREAAELERTRVRH
ncbi:HEAT repeat domain-containing protein [Actinoplanes sp. NEAU-A12]|uniref:HEAT repeat domain-containing protein n=1 Tax=Actinoplanes sandaracinus TaxID=3045177 RepID=A0ABT6WVY1_9ACTN|nr:HEAT repeat domain-containing protein [Actinoplanes sandaracinus]MDI6103791.1 HEAT repeat domain-containing protein [Actinoplanes sandaracinus]